jgi:hypothetical protein
MPAQGDLRCCGMAWHERKGEANSAARPIETRRCRGGELRRRAVAHDGELRGRRKREHGNWPGLYRRGQSCCGLSSSYSSSTGGQLRGHALEGTGRTSAVRKQAGCCCCRTVAVPPHFFFFQFLSFSSKFA